MRYVVIGGTGTLGSELIKQLGEKNDVLCFSRDELKQKELKQRFPFVKCILGDCTDKDSLRRVLKEGDTVFHVAALKHVDTIEYNVAQGIKTNVIGTMNVADVCIENKCAYMIFCSTDKAVLPINAYGYTKGLGEKYLFSLNKEGHETKFGVYRWGNVIGSRGSFIPKIIEQLKSGNKITITDHNMTRFWIRISDAVSFMLETYKYASKDFAMIPDMKAASVVRVVDAISKITGYPILGFQDIGIRAGEKIHECLTTSHSACLRSDNSSQYDELELISLLKKEI